MTAENDDAKKVTKYVFRLHKDVKAKLILTIPRMRRSDFIRQSLVDFLSYPKQPLAMRPGLRGRDKNYQQVCAVLDEEQIKNIKNLYSETSISVVIQAAISNKLKEKSEEKS